ncbi:hypothetical protein ACWOA4_05400 [Pediococcus pentosaceus]|uniref:Uncharacterized protein n=1 Tax=Pediococcus pentosaceus TaxID=1255 RepID=A0AA41BZI3_PEDPE|nr:hypothetical protein [Pediococcus pentosaceus]MBF7105619.1 hypothetical protein [Pediococcus pentosaceus]MBF7109834.1 hypothetical protein [Pediococcus pentosaceus]MBF7119565.1 hypothetical protein [Pediococcus pentosaceus]MBF7126536.1 hypothetical protein [Pediococcus pentosaceus]MBU7002207.1 hypothetical protein [Pediococcus pentosaceus]
MKELVTWFSSQILTQWIAIITAIAGYVAWKLDYSKIIIDPDKIAEPVASI